MLCFTPKRKTRKEMDNYLRKQKEEIIKAMIKNSKQNQKIKVNISKC